MRLHRQCVGCEEASGIRHAPELGQVCESCVEVLDIVEEVVIERLQEATAAAYAFIAALEEKYGLKEQHASP